MEIKKIITEMPLSEVTHWFETTDGIKMFLPHHWGTKVNLDEMTYVSYFDEDYEKCLFPTINDLVDNGLVQRDLKLPYRQCDKDYKSYPDYFYRSGKKCNVPAIQKYFKKNGFNVTEEAILHNFNAWMCDMKSGYRDEVNGYHLFTPCGCNPLSFRVSELHKPCEDWQQTYEC